MSAVALPRSEIVRPLHESTTLQVSNGSATEVGNAPRQGDFNISSNGLLKTCIGSLPCEILVEIFENCVWQTFQTTTAFLDPNAAPISVMRVCKLWNTITKKYPKLWSFVYLSDDLDHRGYLSLWKRMSRTVPIAPFTTWCPNARFSCTMTCIPGNRGS